MPAFIDNPVAIIFVAGLVLILFGPQKLPEILGQIGKAVREFKKYTSDITQVFQEGGTTTPPDTRYEQDYNPPKFDSYGNRVEEQSSLTSGAVPASSYRPEASAYTPPAPAAVMGDFAAPALAASDPAGEERQPPRTSAGETVKVRPDDRTLPQG